MLRFIEWLGNGWGRLLESPRLRWGGRAVCVGLLACLLPVWTYVQLNHDDLAVRARYECSVCASRATTVVQARACASNQDRWLLASAPWLVEDNDYVSDGCERSAAYRAAEIEGAEAPSVRPPGD